MPESRIRIEMPRGWEVECPRCGDGNWAYKYCMKRAASARWPSARWQLRCSTCKWVLKETREFQSWEERRNTSTAEWLLQLRQSSTEWLTSGEWWS